ncbi:P-loop containing nucleoside triphosphate hydrolase protein [Serendipita vermifera]|nr:P-loop containing nucleoside triphosphate hydrolase protein [Serendipita vermifera]
MDQHLSPTNIATYYHNQCQLYLHNAFHRSSHEPVTKPNRRKSSAASKAAKADSSKNSASNNEEIHASSIANAQFQRGLNWESRLFLSLDASEQLIRLDTSTLKSAKEIRDIIIQTAASLETMTVTVKKGKKSGKPPEKRTVWKPKYIANLEFRSPTFNDELQKYGSAKGSVVFGVAKPDLVKITKVQETKLDGSSEVKIVWEIIDAKVSNELKSSHNAQIGFYHLCVDALLSSVKPDGRVTPKIVPSEKVSIWIPNGGGVQSAVSQTDSPVGQAQPESDEEDEEEFDKYDDVDEEEYNKEEEDGEEEARRFEGFQPPISTPILILLPPLRRFLFKQLPSVLSLPRDRVDWHLNPSCQGCEFLDNCKATTIADKRLGMIPDLSISDARFIREVLDIAEHLGCRPGSSKGKPIGDIEELDQLVKGPGMKKLESTYPPTTKRFQKILGLQKNGDERWSPKLDAARTNTSRLTKKCVFSFPRVEDVAIYLSLIIDIASSSIGSFCISVHKAKKALMSHTIGKADKFVSKMAYILRDVQKHDARARVQVYTYSPAERSALMSHLIKVTLATEQTQEEHDRGDDMIKKREDVKICLGALWEGTSLLVTTFQPSILSGVLLYVLSKKNTLSKPSLQTCCERFGLSPDGTVEELRKRIENEQRRLAEIGGRTNTADALNRREVGQLAKVVVLKREIERMFALPVPGFVDLQSTAVALLGESAKQNCEKDDTLFGMWSQEHAKNGGWEDGLKNRNRTMRHVVEEVRELIAVQGLTSKLLLNEAKPLEVGMMDVCESDKLRKLLFMLQFETVTNLQALWRDRLDGCPNAPLLRYVGAEKHDDKWFNIFDLMSGTVEAPVEDRKFYNWLLVAEPDPNQDIVPPEIYFDDINVCGLVFPLTRYTRAKWDEQHQRVRDEVFIANISDIRLASSGGGDHRPKTQVMMQTYYTGKQLQKGLVYRISPRLVDFNLNRVLLNLVFMDFQESVSGEKVPFIEMITYPQTFANPESYRDPVEERKEQEIHRGLRELAKLEVKDAAALIPRSSQHRAALRMMLKRLTVIWGPPGTGKTYTLALSTLRMLEVMGPQALEKCPIILMTAMTHAAIDAIISKVKTLIGHYKKLENRDNSWLNHISLERVHQGGTHCGPVSKKVFIYTGTTFQLYKFCEKFNLKANLIIIDEAGQLALGTAALVLRWLSEAGKLVLAGDHQQLAPILAATYPDSDTLPLFGSVLDLFMGKKNRPELSLANTLDQSYESQYTGAILQLLENFRLNPDLGEFVQLIYAKKFKSEKSQKADIAESLQLWLDTDASEDDVMEQARQFLLNLANAMAHRKDRPYKLIPPRISNIVPQKGQRRQHRSASLAMIKLQVSCSSSIPYEMHVKAEARLAAALVHWLIESFGVEESIFVACPHRIQRSAVRQAILSSDEASRLDEAQDAELGNDIDNLTATMDKLHLSERALRIDTVERLQGSEASFVIFLLSHTHQPSLNNHLEFLLSLRRLNVGISRARTMCILISSKGVLQPPLEVLSKEGTRDGLQFLRAYEDRAWIGDVTIEI